FAAAGGRLLLARQRHPSLTIVGYHAIAADDETGTAAYIAVKVSALRRQIEFFKRHYTIVPLAEAVSLLQRGALDRRYLCLTFDDGYRDFLTRGVPVFTAAGVSATVFLTTDCAEKGVPIWPDTLRGNIYAAPAGTILPASPPARVTSDFESRLQALKRMHAHAKRLGPADRARYLAEVEQASPAGAIDPRFTMLSWDDARRAIELGTDVGLHTMSHTVLSVLSEGEVDAEVRVAKALMEARLGREVTLFAYPNGAAGDFRESDVQAVRDAGFRGAVTTERGVNYPGQDPFRLRRTEVYVTDRLVDLQLKLFREAVLTPRHDAR
ncbi:MAG: polysaccharide deacetylase, partial [Acidobacteria bacterium]|nr:polysaccharide deacetylase [Acidobacteriota bacterium]